MAKQSKDNGTKGELIVAKLFQKLGYWVHITNRNRSGQQPVDIIALRSKIVGVRVRDFCWLVDAKYVQHGGRFDFSDIQPDQIESLSYANEYAKLERIGFAIVFAERSEEDVFFLPFNSYKYLVRIGEKSARMDELYSLETWERMLTYVG